MPLEELASDLMDVVASRDRRYLWTDAFAVCNLVGLGRVDDAVNLVERVHLTLGRHREDGTRRGWLSGLSDADAAVHPTIAGLRIGKKLPERGAREPEDPELEWDRDGQYFHYLTKWMHALDCVARATRRPVFLVWARELARTAHRGFTVGRRMRWKMSVDLTRPLVSSMGHHDPLDGFVTCAALDATADALGRPRVPDLSCASADFDRMLGRDPEALATSDPLGVGGLLFDAWRLARIEPDAPGPATELAGVLLEAALVGMHQWMAVVDLRAPASTRVAFRELGLAIGLAAVPAMARDPRASRWSPSAREALSRLMICAPLREAIVSFWLVPDRRRGAAWTEHEDINEVMLATSLAPAGFLGAPAARARSPWREERPSDVPGR